MKSVAPVISNCICTPTTVPPGTSRLPVMAAMAMRHCVTWQPFGFWSTATPMSRLQ